LLAGRFRRQSGKARLSLREHSRIGDFMGLSNLLTGDQVLTGIKAGNKKQLLQEVSGHLAPLTGLQDRVIYETLLQRERLGSTGIGKGIAIPHGRVPGLSKLVGLFARLARPVEFDAQDGEAVDLVFVLLAPEDAGADHLQALARIARLLRLPGMAQTLRQTEERNALYAILTAEASNRAA
jgi:nitrogen PTS system EIIA component